MSNASAAAGGPGGPAAPAGLNNYYRVDFNAYFTGIFDNLQLHVISSVHDGYPAFVDKRNREMQLVFYRFPEVSTVIEITANRKGTRDVFPLVAAVIRSGHKDDYVVHEIYSLSISTEYKTFVDLKMLEEGDDAVQGPSIVKELLRYVLSFHQFFKLNDDGRDITETAETQPILYWTGIRTDVDPREITILMKLYRDVGFFFPNIICMVESAHINRSYVNNRKIPLGGDPGFSFIAGYWSTAIKEYTDKYTDALFNADNASFRLNGHSSLNGRDYGLLHPKKVEHAGFLNITGGGAEVEPVNPAFVAGAPPDYAIDPHEDVYGGTYTFRDQVKWQNSAPGGTFFQDPTKNPFKRLHFHTHPLVCHVSHNLARGFPSQPDIQLLFRTQCDMKVGGLMVFSREGMWLIRMNPYLLFLKVHYPDRYEFYRAKAEAYLEPMVTDADESQMYNATRDYTADEIAKGTNTLMHILSMSEPSVDDLKQAESFLELVNSRYMPHTFGVEGMEMALFSVQFIKRNQDGYNFTYIKNK